MIRLPVKRHNTGIEWTWVPGYRGETLNPIGAVNTETGERGWFCSHVNPDCTHCYAEAINVKRPFGMGTGLPFTHQSLKHVELRLFGIDKPLRWSEPRSMFVNSMTDWMHDRVPLGWIHLIMAVAAVTPRHLYITLTKRAARQAEVMQGITKRSMLLNAAEQYAGTNPGFIKPFARALKAHPPHLWQWPLPNLWVGVSAGHQNAADQFREPLQNTPAAVKLVSYEPALEAVDWTGWDFLDWMLIGGESGPEARPFDLGWARDSVRWCRAHGVLPFVKQLGSVPVMDENAWRALARTPILKAAHHDRAPIGTVPLLLHDSKGGNMDEWPEDLRVRQYPNTQAVPVP